MSKYITSTLQTIHRAVDAINLYKFPLLQSNLLILHTYTKKRISKHNLYFIKDDR